MHIVSVESVSVCVTAKNIQLGKGWEIFQDILCKPCIILATPGL